MKTTKEQRAELRARTPTSQQSMYQLYVRRAELHAVLDDLDEAEARAERYETAIKTTLRKFPTWALEDLRAALAETANKPHFDYARIADPESAGLEEDEKRVYVLAPLKKRKRAKRKVKK